MSKKNISPKEMIESINKPKIKIWILLLLFYFHNSQAIKQEDTSNPISTTTTNSNQNGLKETCPDHVIRHRNCRGISEYGYETSGVYIVYPHDCCPDRPVRVYCDLDTDGGGWTVIQRRDDVVPREDFQRTWIQYAQGFGNVSGEFWLGLDHIHALTEQHLTEVRIDLSDFDGEKKFAKYKHFYVHDRIHYYVLEVDGYTGTAGDSLSSQNGMKFSSKDKDLDTWSKNCAAHYKCGWWHASCYNSCLNGVYMGGPHSQDGGSVNWGGFKGHIKYSLKFSEMKIRPIY